MSNMRRDLDLKRRRAAEADRLSRDPLLKEALDQMEREAVEDIVNLPLWRGFRRRMTAIVTVRTIRGFREHLQATIREMPEDKDYRSVA